MDVFSNQSLQNLLLLTALGALISFALSRLRLPVVSGLLFAGALLGPQGLGLVQDTELIHILSKIGVVLLMFTIGLSLSPRDLQRHARVMALGGLAQVVLTLGFTAALGLLLGLKPAQAIFLGMVVSQSSTAIVLRALSDRHELNAPHGRLITGALLFQDLSVVPMLVLLPVLGGGLATVSPREALGAVAESAAILGATWIGGRRLVPRYFRSLARAEGNDVFLLSLGALLMASCWLSAKAGLSTALGAFLAGLLLAEGDLGERTLAQVLPFRELSTAVFFLSLGMLFDAGACLSQGRSFAALLIMFTLGKAVLAGLAARLMKFPLKIAALSGVGLGQFSEFGYVLLQGGLFYKILGPSQTAVILSAGVASMILTPLALRWAPRFLAGEKALAPLERLLGSDTGARLKAAAARTQPDVLLLGWGPEAVGLAAQLARHGLRCLALECDPAAVTSAQDRGEPVAYGDALSPEVLLRAGVAEVRGVVSLLPADLTGQAAASLSRARPGLALLAWVPNSDKKALLFRSRARAQVVDDVHVLVGRLKRDAHGA